MKSFRLDYYNPREKAIESIYDEIKNNLLARFNMGGYYKGCEIKKLSLVKMTSTNDEVLEILEVR
jgi:hypothetical protein